MRLFIGIELPVNIRLALLELQEELKGLGVKGKWKRVENIHLTLEFLGEAEPASLPLLQETLTEASKGMGAFNLSLYGTGAFPSFRRPHTLWAGIGGNVDALHQLRDNIHNKLIENGFPAESRPYKPHITLASRPDTRKIDLSVMLAKKSAEFTVDEVVLFESTLEGGRRIHTGLQRVKL